MVYNEMADLTHLSWTLSRKSSGTAGSFLKSYEESKGIKYYYKLSNFDIVMGIYGHECINEMIAQNVADVLQIPHLQYDLIHAKVKIENKIYETWLTRSTDFKIAGEHKLAFETYYEMNRQDGEGIWAFILRNQLEHYFYQVFVLDYLICNRDRHGANIEVLEKQGVYRLAPVFDNGLSLMFSCYKDGEAMQRFDCLKDGPVNNFVGSMSLSENLKLVPKEIISAVQNADLVKNTILNGLEAVKNDSKEVLPLQYWDCVPQMIQERRNKIEKIFNQG